MFMFGFARVCSVQYVWPECGYSTRDAATAAMWASAHPINFYCAATDGI